MPLACKLFNGALAYELSCLQPQSRLEDFMLQPLFRDSLKAMNRSNLLSIAGLFALLAFATFQAVERFPEYTRSLVVASSVDTIVGRVTRVRDGDTIEVEKVPIRLGSLNCPERKTARGDKATRKMKSLIAGQKMSCYLNGRKSYDRFIGSCVTSDGRDVGAVMIEEGYCRRYW